MSKHTPGPWIHIGNGDIVARSENYCGGEKDIASVFLTANDEDEANASRIVACVNACEGIDDNNAIFLKGNSVRKVIVAMEIKRQRIEDQRNELLEALKDVFNACLLANEDEAIPFELDGDLLDAARAAIAKATGEQP